MVCVVCVIRLSVGLALDLRGSGGDIGFWCVYTRQSSKTDCSVNLPAFLAC